MLGDRSLHSWPNLHLSFSRQCHHATLGGSFRHKWEQPPFGSHIHEYVNTLQYWRQSLVSLSSIVACCPVPMSIFTGGKCITLTKANWSTLILFLQSILRNPHFLKLHICRGVEYLQLKYIYIFKKYIFDN